MKESLLLIWMFGMFVEAGRAMIIIPKNVTRKVENITVEKQLIPVYINKSCYGKAKGL